MQLFLGVRMIVDAILIADYLPDHFTPLFPGLRTRKRVSLVKTFKELAYTLILVFAATTATPQLSTIPQVRQYLSMAVMGVSMAVAAVLCYDAGKTFYSTMEPEVLIDRLFKGERPARRLNGSGKAD